MLSVDTLYQISEVKEWHSLNICPEAWARICKRLRSPEIDSSWSVDVSFKDDVTVILFSVIFGYGGYTQELSLNITFNHRQLHQLALSLCESSVGALLQTLG
jgi:hypothetical protein